MKRDWAKYLLALIFILIIIPLGVAFMLSFRFIITDTTNEWIGFWGGYIGSILGGIITLFVMWKTNKEAKKNLDDTIDNEKELEKRREKIEYFDKIIFVVSEYLAANSNMCKTMTSTLNALNIETYFVAYGEKNAAAKMKVELGLLLETRQGIYDVEEFIIMFEEFEKCSNAVADEFDNICKKALVEKQPSDIIELGKFYEYKGNLYDKISPFEKIVKETVRKNLY